jgi:hypothetical protein
MAATRRPCLPLVTACAGALLCGACLPIARTVTDSPAIAGTYRHEGGRPVAGAPLALSIAYGDSTCTRARFRTTTDSAGRFAFPAIRHRERIIILLPVDRLFGYTLCGGETATTTIYAPSYMHSAPDSSAVECIHLAVPELDGRRTSCRGRTLEAGKRRTSHSSRQPAGRARRASTYADTSATSGGMPDATSSARVLQRRS